MHARRTRHRAPLAIVVIARHSPSHATYHRCLCESDARLTSRRRPRTATDPQHHRKGFRICFDDGDNAWLVRRNVRPMLKRAPQPGKWSVSGGDTEDLDLGVASTPPMPPLPMRFPHELNPNEVIRVLGTLISGREWPNLRVSEVEKELEHALLPQLPPGWCARGGVEPAGRASAARPAHPSSPSSPSSFTPPRSHPSSCTPPGARLAGGSHARGARAVAARSPRAATPHPHTPSRPPPHAPTSAALRRPATATVTSRLPLGRLAPTHGTPPHPSPPPPTYDVGSQVGDASARGDHSR